MVVKIILSTQAEVRVQKIPVDRRTQKRIGHNLKKIVLVHDQLETVNDQPIGTP